MKKNYEVRFYTEDETRKLIEGNDHLYFMNNGMDEIVVREQDIPDIIVGFNRNIDVMNMKFYDTEQITMTPVITTYGEYLNHCDKDLREKIIYRLIKLQTTNTKPSDFKIIDESIYDKVTEQLEIEKELEEKNKKKDNAQNKSKDKKNKDVR